MSEKVRNLLDNWLDEKNHKGKERAPLQDFQFYASSAGSCKRALYFGKVLGEKEFDKDTQKIFLMGNIVHEFIQKEILKIGESEQSLTIEQDGVQIFGRLDHIDDDCVTEIKSTSSNKYVEEDSNDHHKAQLMLYMKAKNRKIGRLIYVEKNSFDIVEHQIEYNEELANKTIKEFREVTDAVRQKVAPARLPDYPKGWKCRYCNHKEDCKK